MPATAQWSAARELIVVTAGEGSEGRSACKLALDGEIRDTSYRSRSSRLLNGCRRIGQLSDVRSGATHYCVLAT
ncbi:hypothetical protein MTO96_013938 [Rhipicephalus appendiculatus]